MDLPYYCTAYGVRFLSLENCARRKKAKDNFKNPLYPDCLNCGGPELMRNNGESMEGIYTLAQLQKGDVVECKTEGCTNIAHTRSGYCRACHCKNISKIPRVWKKKATKDNGPSREKLPLEHIMPALFPEGILIKTPEQWQALKQLLEIR